jgi:D-alanyl-D-alanine carboxypeptidase
VYPFRTAFLAFILLASVSVSANPEFETALPAELRAALEQVRFEAEYELFLEEEVLGENAGDPNWYQLLRPSLRMKRRKNRRTYYVQSKPTVQYGVIFPGPAAYQEGEKLLFPPASTSKLFTAALALRELGPEFVYETKLTWRKVSLDSPEASGLALAGSGDPSLTYYTWPLIAEALADRLLEAGVRTIRGPITYTASDRRWSVRVVPQGWEPRDLARDVGGLPTAFGPVSQARLDKILRARFLKKGITWSAYPALPPSATAVTGEYIHRSAALRLLLPNFLHHSVNATGEALLRKIGEVRGAQSSPNLHHAGLAVLREYATKAVAPERVTLNDGSGLSRTSRITAKALHQFLEVAKTESAFPELLAALPVAGQSGTLERRMLASPATGRIRAKTGTLDGNYQLAGYVEKTGASGPEYHPFVILTQTGVRSGAYCRTTQDQVLATLVETIQ